MKKILTFGVFDYFHLGHLRLFNNCKKYGDYLIVAVQHSDEIIKYKPEAKVLYTTEQRIELLSALRVVDEVIVYHDVCVDFLLDKDFDVLVLGGDQTADRMPKIEKWCKENGKEVYRIGRTEGICSSDIKKSLAK